MTLERSGTKQRDLRRMEARTRYATDGLDTRMATVEASPFAGGAILAGLELTTSAQSVEHGLSSWSGAWIISGLDGTFDLVVSSTSNDGKWIGLAVSSGTHTVTVAVV